MRACAHLRAQEWETTVRRVGRWIDFENDYKTLDPEFMARAALRVLSRLCRSLSVRR